MAPRDIQKHVHDPESSERRTFTAQAVLAMLSGVAITITGCGDDDGSPTAPGGSSGSVNGLVSANHGHTATITSAQLMAGNAIVLDIRDDATHPHTVELSAQEITQIAAGQRVSKVSSTNDSPDAGRHNHTVTFN